MKLAIWNCHVKYFEHQTCIQSAVDSYTDGADASQLALTWLARARVKLVIKAPHRQCFHPFINMLFINPGHMRKKSTVALGYPSTDCIYPCCHSSLASLLQAIYPSTFGRLSWLLTSQRSN